MAEQSMARIYKKRSKRKPVLNRNHCSVRLTHCTLLLPEQYPEVQYYCCNANASADLEWLLRRQEALFWLKWAKLQITTWLRCWCFYIMLSGCIQSKEFLHSESALLGIFLKYLLRRCIFFLKKLCLLAAQMLISQCENYTKQKENILKGSAGL